MFDVGGLELLLITVVALLVIGPERMPDALRTLGLWLGRLRRSFTSVKAEIEKEIGMDEVKRQLHNEAVMDEMKRIEREVQNTVADAKIDPNAGVTGDAAATADAPTAEENQAEENQAEESAADVAVATATETPVTPADPEPPKPLPRTEAEVEAAYERKMRAQQNNTKEQS